MMLEFLLELFNAFAQKFKNIYIWPKIMEIISDSF